MSGRRVVFGRCSVKGRQHVSRPLLVRRLTADASMVVCTGGTRRGGQCGDVFVMFDQVPVSMKV